MHQKTKYNRLLALLTSMLLLVSCFPTSVLAEAAADTETTQPTTEVTELSETAPPDEAETISADETDTLADETPAEAEDNEEPPAVAEDAIPLVELDGETVEEAAVDDLPADEQLLEEAPADDLPNDEQLLEELPADDPPVDEQPPEELPAAEPDNPESVIAAYGHAYVVTVGAVKVYSDAELSELLFTVTQGNAALLATEYRILDGMGRVKVWLITEESEVVVGYVAEDALSSELLSDDEAGGMASVMRYGFVATEAGELLTFVVIGEKPNAPTDEPAIEGTISDVLIDEQAEETVPNVLMDEQAEETVAESVIDPAAEPVTDDVKAESTEQLETAQAGDFVTVTQQTRVYTAVDESIEDGYNGDLYDGVFVTDAAVQVESVTQDSFGRYWYAVRYQYGDDFADGTLKWTDYATVYVLASETAPGLEQGFTVTDYAFDAVPRARFALRSASPMNGFSLKSISVSIPTFYAGQSGLYGSSGKDSDYLQIAKSTEHGTIYATPHYLNGFSVYCLEHNLSGPGENISGGGQEPTGPYMVVDIDSYRNNPGYSSIIYHESTLHAIGWVLRHTYPFMALDRSDSDNLVWSRVAGQFAIREVIKQLEGAQYVRSYWDMDNFYRASGQAPAVYLEYARWLAANGIARASMTGNISVSGKSVSASGGGYIGTVTLTTDADLMRISRSVGSLTGNTAGTDGSYYYLNSGDTVAVTSASNRFTIAVESVSSADEEANFLVGVPSVEIQKVLIPQYGAPYKLKSVSVPFEAPLGSISVIKKDAATGAALSGATFELLNGAGSVLQTQATGANGTATFSNLQPGSYIVREKSAPQGYTVSVSNTQNTTVTAGNVSTLTFTNDTMTGKIRIIKKDKQTKEPLAGAKFTITRLSAPAGRSGAGQIVATITTDANGVAETGWLDWGKYKVEETTVPLHYVDSHFSTTIEAYENGKTYTVEVENEPTKGWIRLVKTDDLDDTPIAGVQFDIYYNDEYGSGLAGSMTTDATGVAISPALRKGRYIVREHENPTGYVTELVELDATVRSDETTELSATNQPIQGKIRITKRDELTQELLAGAEFTITRVSGLPSHNGSDNGEVVAMIITDAYGVAESPLLTWGTYRVEETVVPTHFVDNAFSAEVVIDSEDQRIYKIDVENEPTKGWIRLTKTDRQNGNPIEGVQFDIYYNDEYGEGLATSMVTGADGIAVSEPLRKGRYIVREHGETAGYVFEKIALDATVKSDETTELCATNCHVTVRLKLYKRDAEAYEGDNPNASAKAKAVKQLPEPVQIDMPSTRGDGVLTGAAFQVLAGADVQDRQGNVVYAKGAVVVEALLTAGDDASVTTDELWPGLYEIVELTPPVGYAASDTHFYVDARSAAYQSQEAVVTYEGLKTNTILYGAFGIVKFMGDNTVHSDAGIIETPEKGAEFEVYLKSAGSYENARSFERDYLKTNKYGKAQTKALPYGVYVLRQVVGAEGYAIMRPIDIMIDGMESLKDPPTLILNNEAIHYRLRIVKLDAETGKPVLLANTAFKLKDAGGNDVKQSVNYPAPTEMDTFLTNENGEVTLPETVTWGQYFIEEVQSPEGYLRCTENIEVFVGHTGDTADEVYEVTAEVPDTPVKGRIAVEKKGLLLTGFETFTDAYGNEVQRPVYEEGYLAGAVFEVRAAETILGKDGTVWYEQDALADTVVTSSEGPDKSKTLPLGKYYLLETEVPEGYASASARYDVELAFADSMTAVVEVTVRVANDYLPVEVSLTKEAEVISTITKDNGVVTATITNEKGEGFVFGLFNASDIHCGDATLMADTLVATGATDANGALTFSGCYPHGEYYIRELFAPAGWKLNPMSFAVSLTAEAANENVIRVALPEAVHDELIYATVTLTKKDITGENTLPGTQIEVRNSGNEIIYRAYTDENGQIPDIPVTPGTYTFREVLAPEGYSLNEAVMTFTVDEHGGVTGDTVIRDDYTRFSLLKQDENGIPLPGVTFGLKKADGTQVATAVSDANGLVVFEKIPYGSYTVVETKPLSGYVRSDTKIQITIDGTFVNPSAPLATIVNQRIHVHGVKVDTSGRFLAGAEFSLIKADTGEVVETVTSNEKGEFVLSRFDDGSWIVRETKAPEGFLPMQDITLHVDESWTEPAVFTCVNIPNHYAFMKTDHEGNPLSGVRFVLEDENGNVLRELTSGADGVVQLDDLTLGSYVIRETEALEGYQKTEETLSFTIDENYVVADEMPRLINYAEGEVIQTGFEMEMTPVMWTGAAMMLTGIVLAIGYGAMRKGKKRHK